MPDLNPEPLRLAAPPVSSRGGQAVWARSVLRLQRSVGNREVVRMLGLSPALPVVPMPDGPMQEAPAQEAPLALVPAPAAAAAAAAWQRRLQLAWRRLRGLPPPDETVVLIEERR
ncbi:hypothetical protein ACQ86G_21575 [Roseateles chitinivorans]|uniref:hypothetical protein n=1 Tax=Roseateles chitinivorans TaxID=2917965 RepID=UPI003D67E6CD